MSGDVAHHGVSEQNQDAQHTLILGGARSGKTARALQVCHERDWRIYVATAEAHDDEMRARIANHRAERGDGWVTVEAPLNLAQTIDRLAGDAVATSRVDDAIILVDCLTLWLSNLVHAERDVQAETDELLAALARCRVHVVLVSNEVGLGIVPENALARAFRDAQGRLNQAVARAAGTVEFVAAGLPMRLKTPNRS